MCLHKDLSGRDTTQKYDDSRDKVAVRRLQQSSESCLIPSFVPQLPPRLNSPKQP